MKKIITKLSDIFIPIIPIFLICGLLGGVAKILLHFPKLVFLHDMFFVVSQAPLMLLPVLLGYSAAKAYGGNVYLGASLGLILISESCYTTYHVNYTATVLPIIVLCYIQVKIEKFLKKYILGNVGEMVIPLIAIVITSGLTFFLLGPMLYNLGEMLTKFICYIYTRFGYIGSGILGLIYAPLVVTGLHHAFLPIETQLIAEISKTGGTFITPIATMSNVSQAGAVLAVMLTEKDKKEKNVQKVAMFSALMGITEPAMFGVTLKKRKAFYASLIGSMIASIYISYNHILSFTLGVSSVLGFIAIPVAKWLEFFIGLLLAFFIPLIITIFLNKNKQ